jgi:hypothetical protein
MTHVNMSVILNTARTGHAMVGYPNIHHFNYTIDALRRQTHTAFELIISDYIHDRRKFNWGEMRDTNFPIYHVPVTHSTWKNAGYAAICGTKNNGIMFSEGQLLVFLDDCCNFEAAFLEKFFKTWVEKKQFSNALHLKDLGDFPLCTEEGVEVRDARFGLPEMIENGFIVDNFDLAGYMSMSLEAALKLNGFDEFLDGSRQLEDTDLSYRLKAAGYHTVLNKNLVVKEQQHLAVAPQPIKRQEGYNPEEEDSIEFKPNLKCNGTYFHIKLEKRYPNRDDYVRANHRGLNPEEAALMNPCYKLALDGPEPRCIASGRGCNWRDGPNSKHMVLPDSNLYINSPPIFDLAVERQQRINIKQNYRVK